MRYVAIILLFVIHTNDLAGQELSAKHVARINREGSMEKKLRLYQKYFHRDSVKWAREAGRYWKRQTDSLSDAIADRERALSSRKDALKDGVNSRIYRTVYKPWAGKQAREQVQWLDDHKIKTSTAARQLLVSYFEKYFLDATQNDSLLTALKARMPSLPLPKQLSSRIRNFHLLHPEKTSNIQSLASRKLNNVNGVSRMQSIQGSAQQYLGEADKYAHYGKVLSSADTLQGFAKAEGEKALMSYVSKTGQFGQVTQLKDHKADIERLRAMPNEYKLQMGQLQDSSYVKEQAKKKAEELAMDYLGENPATLGGARKKMELLMKKYSAVPNSNDLSTAIKRTSLKGKTIRERLVFSANFQVLSIEPFAIDLSPSVGYRINRSFLLGVGANYRQTISGDTIPTLSPQVWGYKAFAGYDIYRNFFVYSEFDRNSPGVKRVEDRSTRIWHNAAFAGIGRRFTVHRKVEMSVLAMYNFLHTPRDPIYPRPFVVKVGFQTSELAMRK